MLQTGFENVTVTVGQTKSDVNTPAVSLLVPALCHSWWSTSTVRLYHREDLSRSPSQPTTSHFVKFKCLDTLANS